MIVDLGLPDIDGIDLCRQLRLRTNSPIIVVTADGSEVRMVQALDEGADDYVIKPFSMPELLARIGVAIRHHDMAGSAPGELIVVVGALSVDVQAGEARVNGQLLDLPPREFKLLTMLARNRGRILTYRNLARAPVGIREPRGGVTGVACTRQQTFESSLGDGDGVPRIATEPYIGCRLVE